MWESYLGKVVDRDTPFDIRKGYVRLVDVLCHILERLCDDSTHFVHAF